MDTPRHPRYRTLDAWRGLACSMVIAFHSVAATVATPDFITPMLIRPGGCFDRIRGPAHLVVFRHADHYAWIDPRPRAREAMIAYTLAFLDTHLRGAPPDVLSRRRHGVTLLWNK